MAKRRKRPYCSNNWRALAETESKYFQKISFIDFFEFHVANWMLLSSHDCVIRATRNKDGKIQEFSYKYRKCAQNKIKKLIGTHTFVVCDEEAIHQLSPNFND